MARLKKRKRVLLDCDGIIVDFAQGLINALHKATNGEVNLTVNDFPSWDMYGRLDELEAEGRFGTLTNVRKLATAISRLTGFCESLPIYEAAQEGLPKIIEAHKAGLLDLFVVTAPFDTNPTWVFERNRILKTFDLDAKQVIHAGAKYPIAGDLFIDDKDTHLDEWLLHNDGAVFLWDTPHNRNDGKNHKRLKTWKELHEILRIK